MNAGRRLREQHSPSFVAGALQVPLGRLPAGRGRAGPEDRPGQDRPGQDRPDQGQLGPAH